MKNIKITVLCENSVYKLDCLGEHGFSVFVETDNGAFLFDTGGGKTIIGNSLKLKKDLRNINKIIISHGHYDHTGGLPDVLKIRGEVKVHAHPHIFLKRMVIDEKKDGNIKRFVGIPYKREYLESLGARFFLNTGFTEVEEDIYLTGEVPRKFDFEKPDPRLFAEVDGKTIQDILLDDQTLIINTKKGLVLIFGCAHSGMINIINHVMDKMKKENIYAILGGTHLDFLTSEQLEESIKSLKEMSIERIGVSHCTGLRAACRLYQEFGDKFHYGYVGSVLEI